jgi:hypothetical protein
VDEATLSAVADFVRTNREPLASLIRQKLIAAGAKPSVGALGKEGIEQLRREAAGILLDLACALIRRMNNETELTSEAVLHELPEDLRDSIGLPRSDAYYSMLDELKVLASKKNPQ